MRFRSVGISVALVLATCALGLAIRFAHLGLPGVMVKYGGSGLWALMIYWIVSSVPTSWRWYAVALLAGGIATTVELVKLYHSPGIDAFRLTIPGMLLLGRFFSFWDIAVYWVAIGGGALLDRGMRRHCVESLPATSNDEPV